MKTSLKNRLRILSNHLAIIPSRQVFKRRDFTLELKRGAATEFTHIDDTIYHLAVPVLKKLLNLVISRSSRAGTA